jgi:KDO2-lipid IV(A) lauroyltransferase
MLHPDPASPVTRSPSLPLWLRVLSHLPWSMLYALGAVAALIAERVLRYRRSIVRANIAGSFPEIAQPKRRAIEHAYYRNKGDLLAEVVKAATLRPEELLERVSVRNLDVAQRLLASGSSVLIACAHQCNWEWMLLTLALKLRYPLTAAYKPLREGSTERWMRALRTRFGGELVPAKELLMHVLRRRAPHAVAMVADQEPVSSDHKWWTPFLNRPTAFYMGPEKIAQRARLALIFAGMRRIGRGRYEVELTLIADASQPRAPGLLTERYARLVESQVKAQPGEWLWSHRRWKLRRPLYATASDAMDPGASSAPRRPRTRFGARSRRSPPPA